MVYLLIFVGVLFRLLPHPPNFAPITALALFGGARLRRRDAVLVPLASLLISDYFISGFYGPTMFYVYGSFLLISLIGLWLRARFSLRNILASSLLASFLFFTITNFGVWASPTSWYSRDLKGLIDCYLAALPFYRNTALGDFFYTAVFFGTYGLAQRLAQKFRQRLIFSSTQPQNPNI